MPVCCTSSLHWFILHSAPVPARRAVRLYLLRQQAHVTGCSPSHSQFEFKFVFPRAFCQQLRPAAAGCGGWPVRRWRRCINVENVCAERFLLRMGSSRWSFPCCDGVNSKIAIFSQFLTRLPPCPRLAVRWTSYKIQQLLVVVLRRVLLYTTT